MIQFQRFRFIFALALTAVGCASRAPSLRMLDSRADYDAAVPDSTPVPAVREAGIDGFRKSPVSTRTRPKVAAVWIHPHETATRDYFWGGWLSVVVEPDQWVLTKPNRLPEAEAVINSETAKPPKTDAEIKPVAQDVQDRMDRPTHADFVH